MSWTKSLCVTSSFNITLIESLSFIKYVWHLFGYRKNFWNSLPICFPELHLPQNITSILIIQIELDWLNYSLTVQWYHHQSQWYICTDNRNSFIHFVVVHNIKLYGDTPCLFVEGSSSTIGIIGDNVIILHVLNYIIFHSIIFRIVMGLNASLTKSFLTGFNVGRVGHPQHEIFNY